MIVDGKDVTFQNANKRGMGMVFQAYSLFPHMTARENVEYGLKLRAHKTSGDKRKARSGELLELVGLSTHANHYPYQLSGGQQQRVALARALAISPKVLLLDEPLSALDAKVRTQLREEIRRIQLELGTTTLFVTHDQEEALSIADRVGVMRSGRLEQIAAPAEILLPALQQRRRVCQQTPGQRQQQQQGHAPAHEIQGQRRHARRHHPPNHRIGSPEQRRQGQQQGQSRRNFHALNKAEDWNCWHHSGVLPN